MKLDVIPARNIDLMAYAAMQRSSFAEMLEAYGVTDSFMTPEYYRWKYESPWGEAKIAVVTEQGEMVASNAMLPYVLRREGDSFRAWQSMDTATIPKARGKGYFSKCINARRAHCKYHEDCPASPRIFRRSFGRPPSKDSYKWPSVSCEGGGKVIPEPHIAQV